MIKHPYHTKTCFDYTGFKHDRDITGQMKKLCIKRKVSKSTLLKQLIKEAYERQH